MYLMSCDNPACGNHVQPKAGESAIPPGWISIHAAKRVLHVCTAECGVLVMCDLSGALRRGGNA